jgi:hypothetical protein
MTNDCTAALPARKYIIYACPFGELAGQVDRYMAASRAQFGPNQAHAYMPHCTLTGFFHDDPQELPASIAGLDAAYRMLPQEHTAPIITVREMMLTPEFHGLLLESEARHLADPPRCHPPQGLAAPQPGLWLPAGAARAACSTRPQNGRPAGRRALEPALL